MFKHVVVGCDGTREARDAVALGATIATATNATLSLVGVFSPSWLPIPGLDRKAMRGQMMRWLRDARDALAPQAHLHTVCDSSVSRALRHFADQWHGDLVIVGSDPAASAGHAAISPRGRQLLYDAPFSLALAARGIHENRAPLHTIGVGYDGGGEAEAALDQAAALASILHARLTVRHVVEDRLPALSDGEWMQKRDWDHAHIWESARAGALAATETAVARLAVPATASATVGEPGHDLRVLSQTLDLLVVGSRRWGPVARLISGAVGETLVRDAGCSILIVPRPSPRPGARGGSRARTRVTA